MMKKKEKRERNFWNAIFDYIYIKYAINRIHEKAFRSDLSTQLKKTLLFDELLFPVTY